jgi:hypothetical protein
MSRKRKPHNLIPREARVPVMLRIPKRQHREFKRAARGNGHSLNAEILQRIGSAASADRDYEWAWLLRRVRLIWERMNDPQATELDRARDP